MSVTIESRLSSLVEDLRGSLGSRLVSVVLYGSAARGDHSGASSNLNLLVVVTDDAPERLVAAARTQRAWVKAGNHPLLFVTPEWIRGSTDVFPIEFLDMLDHRKVVFGEDPLAGVAVSKANLRLQCEHELRSLLLKLRAAWLDVHDDARGLFELVAGSFGPVTAVARAALRLTGADLPSRSEDLLRAAASRFGLDAAPLLEAAALKRAGRPGDLAAMRSTFLGFFSQIETLGRALDSLRHGPGAE